MSDMKVISPSMIIGIDYEASVGSSGSRVPIGYSVLVRKYTRLKKEFEKKNKLIYTYQMKFREMLSISTDTLMISGE